MPPKKFTKPGDAAAAALPAAGLAKGPKKARKPRVPAKRPEGMSHADWVADVARRKAENERRRARERVQRTREVAEASGGEEEPNEDEEEEKEEEVTEVPAALPPKVSTGFPPHPQFAGWANQAASPSGYSPSGYSPSPSPRWSVSALYVPAYADGDPHGGFNPNVAFAALPPRRLSSAPSRPSFCLGRRCPRRRPHDVRRNARRLLHGRVGVHRRRRADHSPLFLVIDR